MRPRRRWLRRTLLVLGILLLVGVLLVAAAVGVAYARTTVPDPNEAVGAQTTTVYYNDGETELGRFAEIDRTILPSSEIPDVVREAVVAAEDRTFYDNPGISPTGIGRAVWGIVTREPAGGGSTITQQYVKNYFLTSDQTVERKVREIFIALKVEQRLSKDQILTDYLNTVYFGRNAYGIEAAAQQYFGVPASELDAEQAALLAGVLPAPNRYDPRVDEGAAQTRFDYVREGLVATGAATQAEADAMAMPETVEVERTSRYEGTRGYLLEAAREELLDLGYPENEIDTGGYSVVTTFDPGVQEIVETSVRDGLEREAENAGEALPEGLRAGAVTLDPLTGGVLGMYGGEDLTEERNHVTKDILQAGSTFKPFTLVAGLEAGIPLSQTFDGSSGRRFDSYGDQAVTNFGGIDYGTVDLVDATANSVNTAYVELNEEVGPEATVDAAVRAGLPEQTVGLEPFVSNVLGAASPRVIDMAQAFSTFASQGVRHEWHTVVSVRQPNGAVAYQADEEGSRVFDADVMADTTYALTQVVERGSGRTAQELDRPVAGKTGTSQRGRSAWFVGYTPQLVSAVALYQVNEAGEPTEITIPGRSTVTGGSVPTDIWTDLMAAALEGEEVLEFPERSQAVPSPTREFSEEPVEEPVEPVETEPEPEVVTETVTEEPTPTETPTPTPTETETETPTPSPTTTTPSPTPTPTPTETEPAPDPEPAPSPPGGGGGGGGGGAGGGGGGAGGGGGGAGGGGGRPIPPSVGPLP